MASRRAAFSGNASLIATLSSIVFCILLLKYRQFGMYFGQSILNTLTAK